MDNAIGRVLVLRDICLDKGAEGGIGLLRAFKGQRTCIVEWRRRKGGLHIGNQLCRRTDKGLANGSKCRFDIGLERFQAGFVDKDLEPRLVFVIAAAMQIINLQDCFKTRARSWRSSVCGQDRHQP